MGIDYYSKVDFSMPDGYSQSDYPYWLVILNYGVGDKDYYQVHLNASDGKFFVENGEVKCSGETIKWFAFGTDDNTWSTMPDTDPASFSPSPGVIGQVAQRLVANHNLYDTNGKLFLSAFEVAWPNMNFDHESFRRGISVGLGLEGN